MSHRFYKMIVIIFCLYIGGMFFLGIALPDREFSEMENRYLQTFPKFSAEEFESGRYMKEMENYISDHMVFRDQWVCLKASFEVLTGKKENNEIYFGEDGTLLQKVEIKEEEKLLKKTLYINKLAENVDVPVRFGLIPTASEVWKEKLPVGARTVQQTQWIEKLYKTVDVYTVDFSEGLEQHQEEKIFYKTDHHWTSLGAYYGANIILEHLLLEKVNLSSYESSVVSEDFYGTVYSKSGAWWSKPDEITIYVPEQGKTVLSNFNGKEKPGNLYDYAKLKGKNKYSFFLGGNQPLCIVKSEAGKEQKLLLIRDSYSDTLVPFLSERFGEIHLFDLRYNRLSIKDYVKENEIDQILVLYSFDNYLEDDNLFLLTR